jgi:hypothetical protein
MKSYESRQDTIQKKNKLKEKKTKKRKKTKKLNTAKMSKTHAKKNGIAKLLIIE